jgi:acyl-CoA synthetase (AMP-forming)/AMP-acid ligase II
MLTAQRLLERALAAYGDRTAVVDGTRRLTYRQLGERSARLGNALLAVGADASRPAAALLPNRAEYIEFDVATARAGITRIGISDRLGTDEARYILEHSGAVALVTTPELLAAVDDVPDTVAAVLVVGGTAVRELGSPALHPYEEALASASAALAAPRVRPDAPAYILYTSGTTGRPKGATHSHGGRATATLNMLASELATVGASVMVHGGPLTHGSGSKVIAFLAAGGANVVLPRFDPAEFARAVRDHRATHTFLVPTMIQRLLDAGNDVRAAVRSLEQISFGGAPIAPPVFARAIDDFGPILTQVYGSSEAPHPVTLLRPSDYLAADGERDRLLRSAGRASFATDLRVVDDEGHDVPPGEVGELLVAGDHVLTGYWRDEDATAAAFVGDGWYASGDIVRLDGDGLVTVEDRKRDLIITGGLNVYPSEVERVLAEHPAVREVAVLGYPDDEWGESLVAYVVLAPGGAATENELIEWVRARLASYKKPRRVEFLDGLPMGSTNKVLKKELREALWRGHGRRVN